MSNLVVYENNSAPVPVRFKVRNPDGTTSAYNLAGARTVEFYAKAKPSDADSAALFKYSTALGSIVITADGTTGTYSEISIVFAAADLATARELYFHIDDINGAQRKTLWATNEKTNEDFLEIRNV